MRDGDPAALAGLCDRRGPAVLAYCHHVAGDAAALAAAAEAFGQFRAAVHRAEDPAGINPEALLVNATRHAAARHAAIVAPGHCAHVPRLLAARADRSITLADLDRLDEHLESCWTCRAPVARFKAAERAYRDPPAAPLAAEAAAVIVAAMDAAAPVRADEPPPPPEPAPPPPEPAPPPPEPAPPPPEPAPLPAATTNGARGATGDEAPVMPGIDHPTTEFRPVDDLEPDPDPEVAERAPLSRMPARRGAGAVAGRPLPRRAKNEPRPARARQLPRPKRGAAPAASARPARRPPGARPSGGLRPGVVLPIILVALALVIALFVSGVFGADDPTPSSSNVAPAAGTPPSPRTTPEIVEVPGADDASGAAVERAKARDRAASRKSTAATPVAPPPPAAAPAQASTPAAAKPKAPASKKTDSTGTGGATGIDASNGATGAEQLPPPEDTSTVPELAPPPDPAPAVPPG